MARPAPDRAFEVFGLEAREFTIGNEDKIKLFFAMRDTRNFVAWYFFSEMLPDYESRPFELAALKDRKYDKRHSLRTERAFRVRIEKWRIPFVLTNSLRAWNVR